jgi:ELWxxDGT repeat protein
VHAELMCPAGARPQFEPRAAIGPSEHPPLCQGMLPSRIDRHAPTGRIGDLQQRCVDGSAIGDRCGRHDRPIGLTNPARGERGLCFEQRRPAKRDDEATGGVGVEAMGEPRAVTPARQTRECILDARAAVRAAMHRQARRLVQHDEAGILEQDWWIGAKALQYQHEELFEESTFRRSSSLLRPPVVKTITGRGEGAMGTSFLLFSGVDSAGHANLWITDGTSAGTYEIVAAGAFANGLQPLDFVQLASRILFVGLDAAGKQGLWITDGTAVGTYEINVVDAGITGLQPSSLTGLGNRVLFAGTDAAGYRSLWSTDGTAVGTQEISVAGAAASTPAIPYLSLIPYGLTAVSLNATPPAGVPDVGAQLTPSGNVILLEALGLLLPASGKASVVMTGSGATTVPAIGGATTSFLLAAPRRSLAGPAPTSSCSEQPTRWSPRRAPTQSLPGRATPRSPHPAAWSLRGPEAR